MGRIAGRMQSTWKIRQIERVVARRVKGIVGMGGRLRAKVGFRRAQKQQIGTNDIPPPRARRASGRARRRLHVRWNGSRAEEDTDEYV